MKSKLINVLIVLMFFVGLSVLLYPAVSDYINHKNAARVIASYNTAVNNASAEKIDKMFRDADSYNNRLKQNPAAFSDPYIIGGYETSLDLMGIGVMGYIYIDKIKIELPIYHGTSEGVLQVGVGHLKGTSLPIGGEGTHSVLSGHRGLPSAKLFTNLDKIRVGDTFKITILDRVFTYEVDKITTILPYETDELKPVKDKDYCTLMTCTPYGINTHRLLVRGVRVQNVEDKPGIYIANEAFLVDMYIVVPIFSIPLIIVLIILLITHNVRRSRRKKLNMAVDALRKLDEADAAEAEIGETGSPNDEESSNEADASVESEPSGDEEAGSSTGDEELPEVPQESAEPDVSETSMMSDEPDEELAGNESFTEKQPENEAEGTPKKTAEQKSSRSKKKKKKK